MTEKEAYDKALQIAGMLGINVVTQNKDGSKTIRQSKPVKNKEINIYDIMKVIME